MKKQDAGSACDSCMKPAADCSGTLKQKEEEKAGVAGWGSAERHLRSPVRCSQQESCKRCYSYASYVIEAAMCRWQQCGVAASPPHGDKQLPAVTTKVR